MGKVEIKEGMVATREVSEVAKEGREASEEVILTRAMASLKIMKILIRVEVSQTSTLAPTSWTLVRLRRAQTTRSLDSLAPTRT